MYFVKCFRKGLLAVSFNTWLRHSRDAKSTAEKARLEARIREELLIEEAEQAFITDQMQSRHSAIVPEPQQQHEATAIMEDRNVVLLLESHRRLESFESQASEWARERADMLELIELLESSLRDKSTELQLLHSRVLKKSEIFITLQEQQHAAAVAAATKPASQLMQIQEAPVSALPPPECRGADYAAATAVAGNDTVDILSTKLQQQQQLKWDEEIGIAAAAAGAAATAAAAAAAATTTTTEVGGRNQHAAAAAGEAAAAAAAAAAEYCP
jgi:hypothetical protein